MEPKVKVTVIGGGTGSVSILNGIKNYRNLDISVVVNMTDDGGSNQVVRDEFGILPLSDIRKCIIALADEGNGLLRELFTYRFSKGEGLSGHTLGNLMMMALTDISGSEENAVESAGKLFNLLGKIIPVTYDNVRLVAEYESGIVVEGEHKIDVPEDHVNERIKRIFLKPPAKVNPKAYHAIEEADYLIIGPGDLYTSLLSNVIVEGVAESIQRCKGKFMTISNLMTENGETRGMTALDIINEIERYTARRPDMVLMNNKVIPEDILGRYMEHGETPIIDDLDKLTDVKVIRGDLIGDREIVRAKGDVLMRSLIRHDSYKLAEMIMDIINSRN